MHALTPHALAFVTILVAAVPASTAKDGGTTPDPGDFQSQTVEIKLGSVIVGSDSRPKLLLNLANKTDRTLWLVVRFAPPAPDPACEDTQSVEPQKEGHFACILNAIVPDADYPITIAVFGDSTLQQGVENTSTRLRFGKKDVKRLGEWVEATRLPKTYEHIVLKEKLGGAAAMFGALGDGGGMLMVKSDGLEHVTKKRTVKVSTAQIRGVSMRRLSQRETDAWLVVDYDDAGSPKILALQASAIRGEGPGILDKVNASIQALLDSSSASPATQSSPPETAPPK